jgi:sulfate/thiosulfate transport system substrate-binding protein
MVGTRRSFLGALGAVGSWAACGSEGRSLLHASYEPTGKLFEDVNAAFRASVGDPVILKQSHGGSGKQARSVIDGLSADVVSLALGYDVEAIVDAGLIRPGWEARFPHGACPFRSTIVLLVRGGNPHGIRDWGDLLQSGVEIVTPNPKTSGGARWGYLAAWGWAAREGGEAAARDFLRALLSKVPIMDAGARGATTTFVERGLGDVLITWESEALLTTLKRRPGDFELIVPSLTILAEPPVAVVDVVVDRRGSRELAESYLSFLYEPTAQSLAAECFFRPTDPAVAARHPHFPPVSTFSLSERFGSWRAAQKAHFAEGGTFDQVFARG